MAIWDKVKESIDKAGKAAQDVFDEGKLLERIVSVV